MSRNVSSGSSPPLACYSRSDGGCCARVFDHRQLRSACRSGRHDSDRLKRWFMRTPLTSSTTSGVGCESACWASIHPKARLHRRLLGSGGKRVREIDPAWATSRLRHRSEPGHVRPLRPDLGLLGQGRRLGLLGRSGACGCCPFLRLSRPSLGPSRRDCSCRTGSDGRWPGPVGTAVLRPNDLSTNLIRRGAFAQRSGRAGGPQWARSTSGTGMSSRWSSPG